MNTLNLESMRRRMGSAPRSEREWQVFLDLPAGVEPVVSVPNPDELAAMLAPEGWRPVGAILCSLKSAQAAPAWSGWQIRLTYWPAAWVDRTELRATPATYAAAQIAGLRTHLDGCLVADHHGIQYLSPDGRPLARECFWRGKEQLPVDVQRDLGRIAEVDRQRSIGGHGWGRPATGRADQIALDLNQADARDRDACCLRVQAWMRDHAPGILVA